MLKKGVISNIEGNYASVILPDEDNTVTAMLPFANSILAESVKVGDKCVVAFPDADYVNFADGVIISILSSNEKSKVVYGTTVIVDLSEDTVTPDTLAKGVTAHNKDGAPVVGTATLAGEAVESKLPSILDRTVTELTAEDLDGVTAFGHSVFRNCKELSSIAIPTSLRSVAGMVFSGCTALKSVYITDIESYCLISWTENTVFSTGGAVLYLNGELVTDIVIPSNITSLSQYAFYKLTSLESVVFPAGITSVGGWCFDSCTALKTADFTACTAVPSLGNQRSFTVNHADFVIKVPAALYDEWKAATNWSVLASKIIAV